MPVIAKRFPAVTLSAQFAKLVKIACGHPQTHVRNSSLDLGRVVTWAKEIGLDVGEVRQLELAHTAREIYQMFSASSLLDKIADEALAEMSKRVPGADLKILLVDYQGKIAKTFSIKEAQG